MGAAPQAGAKFLNLDEFQADRFRQAPPDGRAHWRYGGQAREPGQSEPLALGDAVSATSQWRAVLGVPGQDARAFSPFSLGVWEIGGAPPISA